MAARSRNLFDRRKDVAWAALKAGILITLGIGIFFAAIFFSGLSGTLFTRQEKLYARFDNASGLRPGSPVWLLGVEIGTVSGIKFIDAKTELTLSIKGNALRYISSDASASIKNMGLLGDKYVSIDPGDPSAGHIKAGRMLATAASVGVDDFLQAGSQSATEIRDLIARLDSLIAFINKGEGSLSKFIRSPELHDEILSSVRNLTGILQQVMDSRGTLSRLVRDPALYREMLSAGAALRRFGNMLADSSNTFAKIMENEETYEDLVSTVEHISRFAARLDSGKGSLGRLGQSDTLAISIESTVKNLNALLVDIRKNPKRYFDFSIF